MNVSFTQTYIESGIKFPFSHLFQYRFSAEVEALVEPSAKFLNKYGSDFHLTFNVSAKTSLVDNEIRGPAVYRKTKEVEFTVFLPFDAIMRHAEAPKIALEYLLKGACEVFDGLGIDTTNIRSRQTSLIAGICADPTMLEELSWDEVGNGSRVRKVFTKFFAKLRG